MNGFDYKNIALTMKEQAKGLVPANFCNEEKQKIFFIKGLKNL